MVAEGAFQYLLEAGQPDSAPAVSTLERTYTYGELRAACAAVASLLAEHGVERGDRVAMLGENSFQWIAFFLATLRSGAVSVPLSPGAPAPEIQSVMDQARPRAAFIDATRAAKLTPLLPDGVRLISDSDIKALSPKSPDAAPRAASVSASDAASLMFTSGSTGLPKGVIVTHGNLVANTGSIASYLGLEPSDRMMVVLPLYYCYGLSLLNTHLRAGGSVALDHRFMFPDKVLERMVELGCTGFAGVPSHYQILLRRSSLPKLQLRALRHMLQAGGKLADPLIRELAATIAPARLFVMYGQTEATARLSYLPPDALATKLGSIGRGIPGITLRVVDVEMRDVKVGEVGEIVAQGPSIAAGYWQDDEATRATFVDGWLRTGDLARVDEDGFIFIVDRAKSFIKCGGVRVSCQRVEEMLLECTDVLEAAVIGMPDPLSGEAVRAFVVPRVAGDAGFRDRVLLHCKRRFPSELVPQSLLVLEELPKNPSGKVARNKLKEWPA